MTPSALRPHRLHALCPYFAMFPPSFAAESIELHTDPGDLVLDPFSGRGTTLLEALLRDRAALAGDINPVAYCISAAKAIVPDLEDVLDELDRLEDRYYAADVGRLEAARIALPTFFRVAYSRETLRQVLFLRSQLRWRENTIQRFITAVLLGHLHGESDRSSKYCSRQMPHTISTKPAYSVRFWREHRMLAPRRDVFELLRDRAAFRLEDPPPIRRGRVVLGNVRHLSERLVGYLGRVAAVITSPPYLWSTRYEEDQWLRLWFLGGPPHPTFHQVSKDDRYDWPGAYWRFLTAGWRGIAPLIRRGATFVCRLGARRLSVNALDAGLTASLRAVWPRAEPIGEPAVTLMPIRTTAALLPDSVGCRYEVDFTFRLAAR